VMRKTDGPQPVSRHNTGGNSYRVALTGLIPTLVSVVMFSAILNVLMLTGSVYMLQVYDRVLSSGSIPTLLGLFAIVIVLYGYLGFYDFLRVRLLSRGALTLDQSTGGAAFQAWIGTGVPGYNSGSGLSKTPAPQPLRDLDTVRGFLSGPTVGAVFDLPFVPLYLVVLFLVHPWLGWATVAGAIVTAGIAVLNRMLTKGPVNRAAALDEAERDFSDKSHRNAEAILAMGMQGAMTARWQGLHKDMLAGGQLGSDPSEMLAATSRAFRMLLQSAILTLGAYLVIQGQMSGGMIIASSVLSGRALAPVDQLIGQWRSLGKALLAHQRLDAFFSTQITPVQTVTLPDPTGQISVTGLTRLGAAPQARSQPGHQSGSRDADRTRILSGISFTLDPGDGLGVIGNSACGKSTLARLLVGAMRPDAGEIRFDGATPDQWDAGQLGRRIGYLPQVVGLLPGTIRDNIARFDPAASDAEVIAAARLTGVHAMILKLPDGYATVLGRHDGVQLSGGQVQRLGLARAIYGRPAIVVLDEPNSNLDVDGDNALTQTIAHLRAAGSTVIVMAHRPSAIAAVNKLMILDSGQLRAFGDKEQVLMAATGLKAGIVDSATTQKPIVPTPKAQSAPQPADTADQTPHIIRQAGPVAAPDDAALPDPVPDSVPDSVTDPIPRKRSA
jgi:ATP-binding cassette, subfamily C, bacterial exporter for protease/lipase